jgi:hypothetical protein
MALRRCLECFRWALPGRPRCAIHERAKQQAKDAKRPTRRSHIEQQRRRQQVQAVPFCQWPGCGATEDLTAGHLIDVAAAEAAGVPIAEAEAGPLVTLCRRHNSSSGATVRRNP